MSINPSFSTWRPHPWHGIEVGPNPPRIVNAFIEICPSDLVKYEIDKETGYLRVERPQRTSSAPPTLYGFIPRTYSGDRVRALMPGSTSGDGDPLDICVVSERPIKRAEVLLKADVIGGIPMLDNGEADDKIVAVFSKDAFWSTLKDISELPSALIERLQHYFMTYKLDPTKPSNVSVGEAYGREHAEKVITAAMEDYKEMYC